MVPLVELELFTLPEHTSSHPVFEWASFDAQSLVLCVVSFCEPPLSFVLCYFENCVVYHSSIYGFWYLHVDIRLLVSQNVSYGFVCNNVIQCLKSQSNKEF